MTDIINDIASSNNIKDNKDMNKIIEAISKFSEDEIQLVERYLKILKKT